MAEIANMGYVAEEADGADRADGTDETSEAKMALRMNALFYFGQKELKNMTYNDGLWEPYNVTWSDGWMVWDGRIIPLGLLRLLEHLRC